MKTSLLRVAAALAVPLLLVTACSSGSSDSSSAGGSSAASRASGSTARGGDAAGGQAADLADTGPAAVDAKDTPVVAEASIISTGSVSLSASDVAKARAGVRRVADAYGGEVTDEETTTADDQRMGYARLVLRIPSGSFAEAMGAVERVAELIDSTTSSTDVSTQVIDVDERVKAARASIDRIRLLLARAERIGDVMAIEAQLASREADLNSLLRQQAHLADQTALSTISVTIDRPAAAAARRASDDAGFLAGLESGWDALRGFATGVATVVGVLLPWAPVIALAGVPVWLLLRRARRTAPPAAGASAT